MTVDTGWFVFFLCLLVLIIWWAGWIGFQMGKQVAIQHVRDLEKSLRNPRSKNLTYSMPEDTATYYRGYEDAWDSAANLLDELCTTIDP